MLTFSETVSKSFHHPSVQCCQSFRGTQPAAGGH
jgi:hypothetical protein